MKRINLLLPLLILAAAVTSCHTGYEYESVDGDTIDARIYTLDNGLKVYMSVNRDEPRIEAHIAVRAGAKNDPDSSTGLAHYFEHLMFKGSDEFGTTDYAAEKPLLDRIEELYQIYRATSAPDARDSIYRIIDSVSQEAARYAIPNEYDKLMSGIGASGTNAYTGMDMTVYTENIPANQMENWARIQAERFTDPVIRGFHTELETVYEEYNMSLTNDSRKTYEAMLSALYPHHPYGTHTVLGTQEHLKSPSISDIKQFYKNWYVPNNMAVCLVGDFDPDEAIRIVDRYFGGMQPNPDLIRPEFPAESPITTPIVREVYGNDAEFVWIGWRTDGAGSRDADLLPLVDAVLNNGKSGIIDLDIIQQQKMLSCGSSTSVQADNGMMIISGTPKSGQSLEEVRDLMLGAVSKLRAGDFDQELIEATVNNFKAGLMSTYESNDGRMNMFVGSFIDDTPWEDEVTMLDRMRDITKDDIVAFANKRLGNDNYAVVYKRRGNDPDQKKIDKPAITPIPANRENTSAFVLSVQENRPADIAPVFLDFSKDLEKTTLDNGIEILYKRNTTNDLFRLSYMFETGSNADPALGTAFSYLQYLGAGDMSLASIKQEFFRIACHFNASSSSERSSVNISGLGENMERAMELTELLLNDPQPDAEVLDNMKFDILKRRADSKLNQGANFSRLTSYALYGPKSPATNLLPAKELIALTPEDLLGRIRNLSKLSHRILYYGPMPLDELKEKIESLHAMAEDPRPAPESDGYPYLISEPKVLLAHYDAKQVRYAQVSNKGEMFDADLLAPSALFNEYFGGGMNSIVFQEMREARALAYSATAGYSRPSKADRPFIFTANIATQNDKLADAVNAFSDIIENMPRSENAFEIAKTAMLDRIRTDRISKADVLYAYIAAEDLGIDYDIRRPIFEQGQSMTLDDIQAFHDRWIKGRPYVYCILGDEKDLDLDSLRALGPIERLTQEQLFGY